MEPGLKNELETLDLIVVDCDNEEPKLPDKNIPSKSRKMKRQVTLSKVDNLENIFVTQNVHVKKQEIKCVINLITNVCDSQNKCKSQKIIERIVPKCFRPICQPAINEILNRHCEHKPRSTEKHKSHKKGKQKSKKRRSGSRICKEKCDKKSKKEESEMVARDLSLSLSSVSLSPFVSDISYEDISLNSFSWCSDSDEGEIDTLIRRARARDQRRCVTPWFPEEPFFASTPRNIVELSDEEMKDNKSIHSLETFVLNPRSDHTVSSNVSSECMEVCDEESDIKNSVPTIDLTDTKFDPIPYCLKKPSKKCLYSNNNIPNKNLQHFKLSFMDHGECRKLEVKTECLSTSAKPFEPTECKAIFEPAECKAIFEPAECKAIANGVAVLCHSECNRIKIEK